MASGFIKINDTKVYAPRWSVFDAIIKITIQELAQTSDKESTDLIKELKSIIPPENFDEKLEMGWGFIDDRIKGTTSRILKLYEMTPEHVTLFWNSVEKGLDQLRKLGSGDSRIHPEFLEDLLKLKE